MTWKIRISPMMRVVEADLLVDEEHRDDEDEDGGEAEREEEEGVDLALRHLVAGQGKRGDIPEHHRQERRAAGDDQRVQERAGDIDPDPGQRRIGAVLVEQHRPVVVQRRFEEELQRRRGHVAATS